MDTAAIIPARIMHMAMATAIVIFSIVDISTRCSVPNDIGTDVAVGAMVVSAAIVVSGTSVGGNGCGNTSLIGPVPTPSLIMGSLSVGMRGVCESENVGMRLMTNFYI
jgi:hypothetical protein